MDLKNRCQEQGINDGIPSCSSSWSILHELTNLRRDVGTCVASISNFVPIKTMKHFFERRFIKPVSSTEDVEVDPVPPYLEIHTEPYKCRRKTQGWPAYVRPFSFRGIAVGTCRDKCRLWRKDWEKPWQMGLHRWSTQQLSGYNRCKLSAHLWRSIENDRKRPPCTRGWGNRVGLLHLWLKPKALAWSSYQSIKKYKPENKE